MLTTNVTKNNFYLYNSIKLNLLMRKFIKTNRPAIKFCGGKKKGGCSWGGATKLITTIRIAA